MPRFYFDENNSGGYTVALGVLCDVDVPHWVYVDAETVDDAIHAFESHYGIDWNEENSYEGNSCNCCGRRFSVDGPDGCDLGTYDKYGQVTHYKGERPWYATGPLGAPPTEKASRSTSQSWGMALKDAPLKKGGAS